MDDLHRVTLPIDEDDVDRKRIPTV